LPLPSPLEIRITTNYRDRPASERDWETESAMNSGSPRKKPAKPKPRPATATATASTIQLEEATETPRTVAVTVIDTTVGAVKILVAEDRLRVVLMEHAGRLGGLAWVTPLGVFVTLVATLIGSNFEHTRLGLAPGAWEAMFVVATVLAFVWLIVVVVGRATWGRRKKRIDACLDDVRGKTSKEAAKAA
jgi:hypothetical protein